jgi:hypothetical protein
MKTLLAVLLVSFVAAPAFAAKKEVKPDPACKKAADKSIAESRDSDADFTGVDEDDHSDYVYSVSRGHDESCFYDIHVKVKKHSDGTCTAGKAEFDGSSANCG